MRARDLVFDLVGWVLICLLVLYIVTSPVAW